MITKIPKFRRCIIQNFPFIEEDFDALTDYELLCKVVEFLNKVINSQNEVIEELDDFETSINSSFDTFTTSINNSFDTFTTNITGDFNALSDKFDELKSYVDNYFDNLDVQDEINQKLDDMVEQGTLQEIITTYIQSNVAWTFDNINGLKLATNLVNGSFAHTFGFYNYNDGGGAFYKIRSITESDVTDEMTLIALNDETLVAELVTFGTINPLQLGAKGDGITNDTIALNKTFSFNKIVFPANKTFLTRNITLPLSTDEYDIDGNFSTLKLLDTTDSSAILDLNGNNCSIRQLKFNGNNLSLSLVKSYNDAVKNSLLIDECEFSNTYAGSTISLDVEYYNSVRIQNSYFHDLQNQVYRVVRSEYVYIHENTFENIGEEGEVTPLGEGTYVGNCQFITITNNSYKNFTGSTVYISYGFANLVNISNNKLENCQKDGIKVQTQAKRAIISNNILKDIYAQAILLTATSLDCIIENNIIEGACLPGGIASGTKNSAIEAAGSHNTVITGNIVRYVHKQNTPGIRVLKASADPNDPTNVNITNNIIDGISGKGIVCENIKNLLIENNNIKNTNLNDTTTKMTMLVKDCIGAINGNSINEPEYVYGICYVTGDKTIQLPKGLTPACIQSDNAIELYANNIESPIFSSQDTTVASINSDTNVATLADSITVQNITNPTELYFKLDVTHIKLNNSFYIQNTGKFSLIGNYVHSTGGYNVYMNQSSNVSCVPDIGTAVNNFWTLNIK